MEVMLDHAGEIESNAAVWCTGRSNIGVLLDFAVELERKDVYWARPAALYS